MKLLCAGSSFCGRVAEWRKRLAVDQLRKIHRRFDSYPCHHIRGGLSIFERRWVNA